MTFQGEKGERERRGIKKLNILFHLYFPASSLLSNEIQRNLNKWCVINIKDAGNNLIALFDRGKKSKKFKWRCYSPEALVPEQTAYDTAKKSPSYYTREELAKIYLTGTVSFYHRNNQLLKK